MSRRHTSFLTSMAREAERQERVRVRAVREAERSRRSAERARLADERERKRQYAEDRMDEVREMNDDLAKQIESLETLLGGSLGWNPAIDFEALKVKPKVPKLDLGDLQIVSKSGPQMAWVRLGRRGDARPDLRS